MKPLNEISRMAVGFSKRWNDAFDEIDRCGASTREQA